VSGCFGLAACRRPRVALLRRNERFTPNAFAASSPG
jgi:hypothetical protein